MKKISLKYRKEDMSYKEKIIPEDIYFWSFGNINYYSYCLNQI